MAALNQRIILCYITIFIIILNITGTISAARTSSVFFRTTRILSTTNSAMDNSIKLENEASLSVVSKMKMMVPSGPSHKGNAKQNFQDVYSVPSPGIGN
ncbi:hypothetical protein M5689_009008 [Euphorbia peplus]|nr:hypothetical protein M5689_009008 [Euphorbia peplus]